METGIGANTLVGKCEVLVIPEVLNPGGTAIAVGACKPPADDVIDADDDDTALLDFLVAFLLTVVLL